MGKKREGCRAGGEETVCLGHVWQKRERSIEGRVEERSGDVG
jgi:hypothetical protein